MALHTTLGNQAFENLSRFKKYCTNKEFKTLEKGVKDFDTNLTGYGYYAIQAKLKLQKIKEMDFNTFKQVMFVYFGKTTEQFIN